MTREEAIEVYNGLINTKIREAFEFFAPELRESEDERIRTLLVALVQWAKTFNQSGLDPNTANKMLSYLEKQKELDKMIVVSPEVWDNAISDAFENGKKEGEKQKEQKPAWSEEDVPSREMILAIWELGNEWKERPVPEISQLKFIQDHWKESSYFNKLKSLRPPWKPSKELLDALHTAAYLHEMEFYGGLKDKLRKLDEQLRKL